MARKAGPKSRIEQIREARAPDEAHRRALAEVGAISYRAIALQQMGGGPIDRLAIAMAPVVQIARDIERSCTIVQKLLDPRMFINAGLSADPDEDE